MNRPLSPLVSNTLKAVCLLPALLVVLCCVAAPARAQIFTPLTILPPEPCFRNINSENGLPSSETYDVHQDREGFIWIATDRGVVRHDGFRFKTFTNKDGLVDNVVFKIYEDYKGRIWFVSYSGLLSYYENGRVCAYKYNNRLKEFIGGTNPTFKSLLVDRQDNLYFAINTLGLAKITASGKLTQEHSASANAILVRKFGQQWIGSCNRKAFYKLPGEKGRGPIPVTIELRGKTIRLGEQILIYRMNLAQCKEQRFLQVDDGIYDLRRQKLAFSEFRAIGVDCMDDELFVGVYKRGVRRERLNLPRNHPDRTSYLLQDYSVSSVMRDSEGGYWFTTLEAGVFYAPNLFVLSYGEKQGMTGMEYSRLVGKANDVYLANVTGYYNLTGGWQIQEPHRIVRRLEIAATRHRVMLSWTRPNRDAAVDAAHDCLFLPFAHDAYGTPDYTIWSSDQLYRVYEDGRMEELYNPHKLSANEKWGFQALFQAVVATRSGKIFAGNLNGVFEISNKEASQAHLLHPLFRERVTDFAAHPELGTIVATRGKGIYCFNDRYRITHLVDHTSGLLSDQVNCVYADAFGYIYVGTNSGLNVLHYEHGRFRHWNVTVNHGLCSNEVNSVYVAHKKVWVATKKGVSVLDFNHYPPQSRGSIRLSFVSIDGVLHGKETLPKTIPPNPMFVKIGIATDNFKGIGQQQFSYQLRPGGAWFKTNDAEILMNEPRSGDYSIRVRFCDDRGIWSRPKLLLSFTIETPFYAEWYVLTFAVLLALGLMAWSFRTILKRVKQRHQYQTTINQLEQKALTAQMNPHFIFNSLNSIQSFLLYEENEKAERYLLKFSSLIRQTLSNSREHYIRLEQELMILQNYLELEQMRFKDRFSFQIECAFGLSEFQCYLPPMLIQPYVENAVLHGISGMAEEGMIRILFTREGENGLKVTIEDNGHGRNTEKRNGREGHRSFGTTITQERLEILRKRVGGEFTVRYTDKVVDGRAAGTIVELVIQVILNAEPPAKGQNSDFDA